MLAAWLSPESRAGKTPLSLAIISFNTRSRRRVWSSKDPCRWEVWWQRLSRIEVWAKSAVEDSSLVKALWVLPSDRRQTSSCSLLPRETWKSCNLLEAWHHAFHRWSPGCVGESGNCSKSLSFRGREFQRGELCAPANSCGSKLARD